MMKKNVFFVMPLDEDFFFNRRNSRSSSYSDETQKIL